MTIFIKSRFANGISAFSGSVKNQYLLYALFHILTARGNRGALTREMVSQRLPPCPCPLSPGRPQSLSRSLKNSSTPSNSFTSAKLIACAASLSTRPVFFHASHKSRMARAQTINDSMGQTTIL